MHMAKSDEADQKANEIMRENLRKALEGTGRELPEQEQEPKGTEEATEEPDDDEAAD